MIRASLSNFGDLDGSSAVSTWKSSKSFLTYGVPTYQQKIRYREAALCCRVQRDKEVKLLYRVKLLYKTSKGLLGGGIRPGPKVSMTGGNVVVLIWKYLKPGLSMKIGALFKIHWEVYDVYRHTTSLKNSHKRTLFGRYGAFTLG